MLSWISVGRFEILNFAMIFSLGFRMAILELTAKRDKAILAIPSGKECLESMGLVNGTDFMLDSCLVSCGTHLLRVITHE